MSVALDHVSREVNGVLDSRFVPESERNINVLQITLSGKMSDAVVAGLDKLISGRILVDGNDVTVAMFAGAVARYQQFINHPRRGENIASPLRAGKSRATKSMRVPPMWRRLKLERPIARLCSCREGSSSEPQLRALVKGADLVLLDEPLANLDYKPGEELRVDLPRTLKRPARYSSMRRRSIRGLAVSAAIRPACSRAAPWTVDNECVPSSEYGAVYEA